MGALEGKGTREARAGSVIGAVCRRGRALGARIARFPTLPCPLGQSRARKRCLSFVALAFPLSRRRLYLTLSVLPFPPLSIALSLSHTHFPISGSLLLTPPPPHRPPSHHHSFLDRFVVYLTAQHLHLSLASTVIAFDLAGRRRQSSRAPSSLFAPNLHPSSPSPHPRTHARTRLRTAPHVHTHFDLVTITPATGHRLHRSSHPRYTTRRRERLPFCAASSTTLASRTRRPIDVRTRQQRTSRTHFIFRRQSTTKTLHCRGSWHWHLERTLFLCNLIICTSQQPRGL